MSGSPLQEDRSLESLVGRVADEFLRRQERGEQPDVEEYTARHPEAAAVLRKILASLKLLDLSRADGSGPAGPAVGEPVSGTLGDFRILREVGRGGMGVVYEAEQISLRRRVALKVLPFAAAVDDRRLRRFQQEAQAAAQLHHQHIVPVYAVGCERGLHYYAMQLINGQTLAVVIEDLRARARPPAPPTGPHPTQQAAAPETEKAALSTVHAPADPAFYRRAIRLGIQAAEALEYAHGLGVIHRDVKPANLLVDGRDNLWVTDFGLAQVRAEACLTATGDLLGTIRYMSPEQTRGDRVLLDHRTDVYSLGLTLYELFTLEQTFPDQDRRALLRQIAEEEPRRPRLLNPALAEDLETILLKAIEKNPSDRYATAQALADDLRRFLDNKPIQARRPTALPRVRKWSRRHQAVVATAGLALLTMFLLGFVGLAVSYHLVSRERDDARAARDLARAEKDKVRNYLYVSDIRVAHQALQKNDLAAALTLLERHRPADGEEDLRGFEWHYLWHLTHSEELTLHAHQGDAYYAAFSPDGRELATAGKDRTVKIWETSNWQLRETLRGHAGRVGWLAYSPDGRTLASSGDDPAVCLWDTATYQLRETLRRPGEHVKRVFFLPGGRVLAGCFRDGKVASLWDPRTGTTQPMGEYDHIVDSDLSPDASLLAVAQQDKPVSLRDVRTGQLITAPPVTSNVRNGVAALAFSHHGPRLAAGFRDGYVLHQEVPPSGSPDAYRTGNIPAQNLDSVP
jgi:serine/threonine protein kinase